MAIKVEPVETEVEYMEDLDVQWISLVDKGANRTPFKIIKSEGGSMEEVIQSVIIPVTKNFDEIKDKSDWSRNFKVLRSENHGDYTKYVNFPLADLDSDTIRIAKISGEDSLFAVVGKPKKPDASHIVYKASVMDIPVGFGDYGIKTFGDSFYDELNDLCSAIAGTMDLEYLDNKKKKLAISNALDAFKAFISAGLDMIAAPVSVAMRDISYSEKKDEVKESEGNMGDTMVEKKNDVVEKANAMDTQPANPDPIPITVTDVTNQIIKSQEQMVASIMALTQKIEGLVTKFEPVSKADESSDVAKADNDVAPIGAAAEPPAEMVLKLEENFTNIVNKIDKLEKLVEKIDGEVPAPSANREEVVKEAEVSLAKADNPFVGIFGDLKKR